MSRDPEQRLWDAFKHHLKSSKNFPIIRRIEDSLGSGFPDVVLCNRHGRFILIELKVFTKPKRASTAALGTKGLRIEQEGFHMVAGRAHAPCFILIRDSRQELYLIHARHAGDLNQMTVAELRTHSVCLSFWEDVIAHLERYK